MPIKTRHNPIPAAHAPRRRRRAGAGRGFTLVELLTVIVIIGLLISILVPSIAAVLKTADAAKSMSRIRTFDDGCRTYKTDAGVYPGQPYLQSDWTFVTFPGATGFTTGTQWLAGSMFLDGHKSQPANGYVSYASDMVDINTPLLTGTNHAVLDAFSKPKALLYFVSRLGTSGLAPGSQYNTAENSGLTTSTEDGRFIGFIKDGRYGVNRPYRDGQFLLIGAGPDRDYFTEDDVTNFKF